MFDDEIFKQNAEVIRNQATKLSEQFTAFEQWYNTLAGKIATEYCKGDICLAIKRQGKGWILLFNDSPIQEASLKIKMAAVNMIPDLLLSVRVSQEVLIQELKEANNRMETVLLELKQS
jgi:hypothetical protein